MNEACPVCGLNLTPEMGFYWGAMYVSYALTVALSFANFVIAYLFFGWLTWEFLIGNAIVLILLLPLIFRISRALWLALFIKYRRQ